MPGYIYRGTNMDALTPLPSKRGLHRGPAKCGTRPGYVRHLREGTDVCQPCRAAKTEYDQEYRKRRAAKKFAA